MQDKAVCRASQVTSSPAHQAVWPDVSLHWLDSDCSEKANSGLEDMGCSLLLY